MTLAEFKAWFEGFTEDMEGAPTAKQWKRIKDRVKQIDGQAVTREVIYRDRYWPSITNQPFVSWGTNTAPTYIDDLGTLGKAEYSASLNA